MNCVPGHGWILGLFCNESTFIMGKRERMSCLATICIWPAKYVAHSSIYELKFQCLDFSSTPWAVSESFLFVRWVLSVHTQVFSCRQIGSLIAVSCFYTYIVLLTKPSGRSESPFLMKISGCCIVCSWAKEFKQQRNPPPMTTRKDLLPSALPEGALLWAMHQLEIKKGPLTIFLFSILVQTIIPCS